MCLVGDFFVGVSLDGGDTFCILILPLPLLLVFIRLAFIQLVVILLACLVPYQILWNTLVSLLPNGWSSSSSPPPLSNFKRVESDIVRSTHACQRFHITNDTFRSTKLGARRESAYNDLSSELSTIDYCPSWSGLLIGTCVCKGAADGALVLEGETSMKAHLVATTAQTCAQSTIPSTSKTRWSRWMQHWLGTPMQWWCIW